jgi:hypothetical protein
MYRIFSFFGQDFCIILKIVWRNDKMKKIMSLLLLGILLMSIIPLAIAEETEEINEEEVEEEIERMSTIPGAEYRLQQLALSLENQIENAKDIISELDADQEVIDELSEYVLEMELLLERINEIDTDGVPEEMAAEFVAVKKEAIELTHKFKMTLISSVNSQKIEQVRERVREMKELRLQEIKNRLEEKKQNMYMHRVNNALENAGIASSVMERVRNGELTREEAIEIIKENFNSLSGDEIKNLRAEVREQAEKAKDNAQSKRAEAVAKAIQKRSEIRENAMNKIGEMMSQFENRIQERKENSDARLQQLRENFPTGRVAGNFRNQNN